MKRLFIALALALIATPALAQVNPGPQSLAYGKSQSMSVNTLYPSTLGPSPFAVPVRGILINCTVAGNVAVTLADGSIVTFQIPIGLYVIPLQVTEVNTAGTTATATYWQVG